MEEAFAGDADVWERGVGVDRDAAFGEWVTFAEDADHAVVEELFYDDLRAGAAEDADLEVDVAAAESSDVFFVFGGEADFEVRPLFVGFEDDEGGEGVDEAVVGGDVEDAFGVGGLQ